MTQTDLIARTGRLLSGLAHGAIGALEAKSQVTTVEQIIRELDGEAERVRTALGQAKARKHRQETHVADLGAERQALDARIESALAQDREDLAAAGIERQLDLDTLIEAAAKDIAAATAEVEEMQGSLRVITAGRRDALSKLEALRRAERAAASAPGDPGEPARSADTAEARAIRALEEIARITGLDSTLPNGEAAGRLDDLDRLHKQRLVAERLAAFKARAGR